MKYPANDETMDCPNCKGRLCAFAHPQTHAIEWPHRLTSDRPSRMRRVDVAFCRSCGEPVIFYKRVRRERPEVEERNGLIYPAASSRPPPPPEVGTADAALASDYEEAVACEPFSLQAAAMLLGLCASTILANKCDAPKSGTLGSQFRHANDESKLPEHITEQFSGLLDNRNRSAHPWFNDAGDRLAVDEDDVAWCFEIVGLLFDHFYVNPARLAERQARLAKVKQDREE